jgi:GNAT superfamily N-acetyltransferase
MKKLYVPNIITIRTLDFNKVAKQPSLLAKPRKLTLHPPSGLNYEMDTLLDIMEDRPVKAKAILAYSNITLIGWALLSKEPSDFWFPNSWNPFTPRDGWLFEVFVSAKHRRKGIGSKIFSRAGPQDRQARDHLYCAVG